MKRDCPLGNSASLNQQPKYSRSSSSPSGTNNTVSRPKCNNQRGYDHNWGKGYRLGTASDVVDGASRVVRSYSSVASNNKSSVDQTDKGANQDEHLSSVQTDKGANLDEHLSSVQTDKGANQDEHLSSVQTDKGAKLDDHVLCGQTDERAKLDGNESGVQTNKGVNLDEWASGETRCSKDVTEPPTPSERLQQEGQPLRNVQSDSYVNGTLQLSKLNGSPNTSNDCSTSNTTENSHSEFNSSGKREKPSLAAVKQSSIPVKRVPEKRKQSHFPPFIDTHCHLEYVFDRYHHHGTFKDFADRHSYPTNFEGCISTFCDPAAFSSLGAWPELLSEPNVWGTFGIHPHNAKYYHTSGLEDKLLEGLQHPKCVAFGEIGLDYSDHSPSDPQTQKDILKHQLQLVVPFGKPVVLHCRNAEQDLFQILIQYLPKDWFIHLHCFTGEPHIATQFMNEFPNLYLGVCGNVTNPRQVNMRSVVCEVPLERLLIETDAPYHVPSNLPKAAGWCRNTHPALAFYVAKEIAKLRKVDLVDVLKCVRTNTRTLYGV